MRIRSILCASMVGLAGCVDLASRLFPVTDKSLERPQPLPTNKLAEFTANEPPAQSATASSTPLVSPSGTGQPAAQTTVSPTVRPTASPVPSATPEPTPTPTPTPEPTPTPLWTHISDGILRLNEWVLGIPSGDSYRRRNVPVTIMRSTLFGKQVGIWVQFFKVLHGSDKCDLCNGRGSAYYALDPANLTSSGLSFEIPSPAQHGNPADIFQQYHWVHNYGWKGSYTDIEYDKQTQSFSVVSVTKGSNRSKVMDISAGALKGKVLPPNFILTRGGSPRGLADWDPENKRLYYSTVSYDSQGYWSVESRLTIAVWSQSDGTWRTAPNPVPRGAFSPRPSLILVDAPSKMVLLVTQEYDPYSWGETNDSPWLFGGDLYRVERHIVDDAALPIE